MLCGLGSVCALRSVLAKFFSIVIFFYLPYNFYIITSLGVSRFANFTLVCHRDGTSKANCNTGDDGWS